MTKQSVPKKWHLIWLGSDLPDEYKENIRRLMKHNPDYEFNLYIDSATLPLSPRSDKDPDIPSRALPSLHAFCSNPLNQQAKARQINLHDIATIPQCAEFVAEPFYNDWVSGEDKHYAFAADVLRLCIIYVYGGVYTDLDCLSYRGVGELVNETGIFIAGVTEEHARQLLDSGLIEDPKGVYAAGVNATNLKFLFKDNWFVAATPKHALILECIKEMHANYSTTIFAYHLRADSRRNSEVYREPNRRQKLFAESVIFSDAPAILGANRKAEEQYSQKAYAESRKICVHNIGKKVVYFGFRIFIRYCHEEIMRQFGRDGLRASVFPMYGSIFHYLAKSWERTRIDTFDEDSTSNKMSCGLLKLRGAT